MQVGPRFAQHFERFVQVYNERFAPTRGPLPPGAQEAVNRYLDCVACGFAQVRCGECGHDYMVAFSCKQTQMSVPIVSHEARADLGAVGR